MDTSIEELKAAIYLMVAKQVDETLLQLPDTVVATPTFLALLVELVYSQLISTGEDLELFANHGGRNTINIKDLFMVTRKNGKLTEALKDLESGLDK